MGKVYMKETVLISGGTDGIGKAVVTDLLKNGFNVSTFSRKANKVHSLSQQLKEYVDYKKLLIQKGDVTDENSVKKIIQRTIKYFKEINILINNAGLGYFSNCDEVNIKRFQEIIQINMIGVSILTKNTVPIMKQNKKGHIINIVSTSGVRSGKRREFYSATKYGIMGFSEGIREELKPYNIKVSVVCPGKTQSRENIKEEIHRRNNLQEKRNDIFNENQPLAMLQVQKLSKIISFICLQPFDVNIEDVRITPF